MNMNEKEIIELVHSTKSIIYNKEMAHAVTVKGAADYVTKVDVAVQEYLRKELDARTPDVILLAEEQENNNLDPEKSKEIMELLEKINEVEHTTVVMVTHDSTLVDSFKKRTISLEEGYIIADLMKGGYLTYDQGN